ncbi:hypothetical protein C8Q69DRAFT_506941 [Paecilomyces variotii]|uniref:Uncharacterized protein n=1 Tax=Byssochlamys spectabilis TaxID=264951 RepID=A0A443HUU4_BYSSP|nr:hypothetical protein C8Q69DRAFT_506941 [Paecilomyces variotii]RWQ95603.1 hypothetical protein C8Q69DRAFT_506941 [Paecilomyces variotii]
MRVAHSASGKAVRPGPGWKRTSGPGRQAWQFSLALLLVTARAFSLPSLFVQLAVSGLAAAQKKRRARAFPLSPARRLNGPSVPLAFSLVFLFLFSLTLPHNPPPLPRIFILLFSLLSPSRCRPVHPAGPSRVVRLDLVSALNVVAGLKVAVSLDSSTLSPPCYSVARVEALDDPRLSRYRSCDCLPYDPAGHPIDAYDGYERYTHAAPLLPAPPGLRTSTGLAVHSPTIGYPRCAWRSHDRRHPVGRAFWTVAPPQGHRSNEDLKAERAVLAVEDTSH